MKAIRIIIHMVDDDGHAQIGNQDLVGYATVLKSEMIKHRFPDVPLVHAADKLIKTYLQDIMMGALDDTVPGKSS